MLHEVTSSRVYIVLASMTKEERKKWLIFVESPYFNTNKLLTELSQLLVKSTGDFQRIPDTYKQLGAKMKATQTHDNIIRLLSKLFTDVTEKYLAQIGFEKHRYASQHFLTSYYKYRSLDKLYRTTYAETIAAFESRQTEIEPEYYFWLFLMQFEYSKYLVTFGIHNSKPDIGLLETLNALDNFYFCNRLDISVALFTVKTSSRLDTDFSFSENIASIVAKKPDAYALLTNMWTKAFDLVQAPTVDKYRKFKEYIECHQALIEAEQYKRFFAAQLILLRTLFSEATDRAKEYLSLCSKEDALLLLDGYVLPLTYRNVVFSFLILKENTAVRTFMNEYHDRITPSFEHIEGLTQLCESMYAFEIGDFKKADLYCQNLDVEAFIFELDVRRLRIKIDYELGNDESADKKTNNARLQLSRKQNVMGEKNLEVFRDFHNFTTRLLKLAPFEKPKLHELKTEVENATVLPEKVWLLNKIDQKIKTRS